MAQVEDVAEDWIMEIIQEEILGVDQEQVLVEVLVVHLEQVLVVHLVVEEVAVEEEAAIKKIVSWKILLELE